MSNKKRVLRYTTGALLAGSLVMGGLVGCSSKSEEVEDDKLVGKDLNDTVNENENEDVENEEELDTEEMELEEDENEEDKKDTKKETENKGTNNKGTNNKVTNSKNNAGSTSGTGNNDWVASTGKVITVFTGGGSKEVKSVNKGTVSKGSKGSTVSKGTVNKGNTGKGTSNSQSKKEQEKKKQEKQLKERLKQLKGQEKKLKTQYLSLYAKNEKLNEFNNGVAALKDGNVQYTKFSALLKGLGAVGLKTQVSLWQTYVPMLENEIKGLEKELSKLQNQEVYKDKVETKDIPYNVLSNPTDKYLKGYSKVTTKGVKGSKKVVYEGTLYKNMKVVTLGKKVESVTKQPVDEVVTEGTRVDYEDRAEVVNFKTVKEDDPYLAKGKTEVTQKGVNGRELVKYEITYKNEKEVDRKTIEEVINEHILVGTMEKVEEVNKEIPFETKKIENPEMFEGETKVTTKGVKGKEIFEYEVGYKNGKQVRKDKVGERTEQPVTEVIEVGTMKVEKDTTTVDFRTVEVENPRLLKGETKLVQEGKKGNVTKTYHVGYKDGKEVSRKYVGTEEVNAVNKVVEVGTMEVDVKNEVVKFNTIKKDEPTMMAGETKVTQKGKNGLREVTTQTGYRNGEVVYNNKIEKDLEKKVDEIILVGTQVTEEKEFKIDYDVTYEEDDSLRVGEEKVKQKGVNGLEVVNYAVGYENGKEVLRNEIGRTVAKEPVTEIILVGQLEIKEESKVNTLPYKTVRQEDPTLDKGKTKVSQKGKEGKEELVYEVKYVKGKEVERREISKKVTEPVDEVILVGTKVTEVKSETQTQDIDYKVEYVNDDRMALGETKVETKGQKGQKEVTYDVTYVNGKEEKRVEVGSKVTVEPVTEVIKVGTVDVAKMEQDALAMINQYRVENGKHELKYDARIANYAREWSKTMSKTGNITHSNILEDKDKWDDVSNVRENIAERGYNAYDAVYAWKWSGAHNANMLNSSSTHFGIGFEPQGGYWTLILYTEFGGEKKANVIPLGEGEETKVEWKKETKSVTKPTGEVKEEPKQESKKEETPEPKQAPKQEQPEQEKEQESKKEDEPEVVNETAEEQTQQEDTE